MTAHKGSPRQGWGTTISRTAEEAATCDPRGEYHTPDVPGRHHPQEERQGGVVIRKQQLKQDVVLALLGLKPGKVLVEQLARIGIVIEALGLDPPLGPVIPHLSSSFDYCGNRHSGQGQSNLGELGFTCHWYQCHLPKPGHGAEAGAQLLSLGPSACGHPPP